MKNKSIGKTEIAFWLLLLHLKYLTMTAFFMFCASILESPCNRSGGIYYVSLTLSIALLVSYPLFATGVNVTCIVFQALALRQNESKIKNIIMMAVTILYEAAVILFFFEFWQNAMSV